MAVFPLGAATQRTQSLNPTGCTVRRPPRVVPPPDRYTPRTPISYRALEADQGQAGDALEVQLSEAGSCLLKPRRHQPDFRFSFRGDCDMWPSLLRWM